MGSLYVGVNGTARKAKRLYVGVNGVARRVKKLYVGVNGVARKIFGGELSYYGTTTALSEARTTVAGISFGNYALFAGGLNGGSSTTGYTFSDTVDSYNSSLTRTTLSSVTDFKSSNTYWSYCSGTTVGNYALIGSGAASTTTIYAYNTSLTQSMFTLGSSSRARSFMAATNVGDYALFVGGRNGTDISYYGEAINSSLTVSTANLTRVISGYWTTNYKRWRISGASVGDYALFAGGLSGTSASDTNSTVFAYNTSLTFSMPTALSDARGDIASSTIGNYALFAGGNTNLNLYATVNAYDTSLTMSTPTALSVGRTNMAATTVGDYALFGGGSIAEGTLNQTARTAIVEVYNKSLTLSSPDSNLSTARSFLGAATAGDCALFAGGTSADGRVATVDVYEV